MNDRASVSSASRTSDTVVAMADALFSTARRCLHLPGLAVDDSVNSCFRCARSPLGVEIRHGLFIGHLLEPFIGLPDGTEVRWALDGEDVIGIVFEVLDHVG